MKNVVTYGAEKYVKQDVMISKLGITEERFDTFISPTHLPYTDNFVEQDDNVMLVTPYILWLTARFFGKQKQLNQHFKELVKAMDENKFIKQYFEDEIQIQRNTFSSRNQRKDYVKVMQEEWVQEGQEMKSKREELGINKNEMAQMIGCSTSKLTRYENGEPINSPKMMRNGYQNVIDLMAIRYNKDYQRQVRNNDVHERLIDLEEHIYRNDIERTFKFVCDQNGLDYKEERESLYGELIIKYAKFKNVKLREIMKEMGWRDLWNNSDFIRYLRAVDELDSNIAYYAELVVEDKMKKEIV